MRFRGFAPMHPWQYSAQISAPNAHICGPYVNLRRGHKFHPCSTAHPPTDSTSKLIVRSLLFRAFLALHPCDPN